MEVSMEHNSASKNLSTAHWAWNLSPLAALLWVGGAAAYIFRPMQTEATPALLKWIIALLMLVNAAVIIWLGRGLRRQSKLFYYLALGYLAFNILLTIFDDFGIADLVYLLYAGALFVLLLLSKRNFSGPPKQ
jgi:lysylphosphatidylglycerol synthetase-like protein (DUF2156 family)